MNSKKLLKGVRKGISRKLFLLAGLITLILCFAFFACGPFDEEDEITSIKLSSSSLIIAAGDVDYLVVTTVPAGKADDVVWSTSANDVVDVAKGKITARGTAAGKSVTVIAKNKSGKASANCSVQVTGDSAGTQVSSISLVSSSITMTVNESRTISYSISPDNVPTTNRAVFWTSSAPGVARVDSSSGIITAVSAGTAVITVTTKNKGKTATCTVTVTSSSNQGPGLPADDVVTSIAINKTALTLEEGETETLTVTAEPDSATNYTVTWTSNKPDIATVDNNGLVTAVKKGEADITAKVGVFEVTCKVTVNATTAGIVLSKTNLTLFTTGADTVKTATITGTVPGAVTAGSAVTWTSDKPEIATVTGSTSGIGATISAVAKGTATITASVTIEGTTKTATCTVTVVGGLSDYNGDYSGTYKSSSNKDIKETVSISNGFIYIFDNETPSNPDYFDFTVDKWEPATSPNTGYPIAFKITGTINGAKPVGTSALYGSSTAANFTQADITNKTPCWMFIYVSSDGKIIRSPFNKAGTGTDNRTAPVGGNTTPRVYTKAP
jgi:uncharacterized protein YjdB